MFDSHVYASLAIVLYVGIEMYRYTICKGEHKSTRIITGVCLFITVLMAWNILAENRIDLENWRSFGPQRESSVAEELPVISPEAERIK
ncbi:MAG: hypothetical protein ABIK92_21715 [Pseudomonadota bacterium]